MTPISKGFLSVLTLALAVSACNRTEPPLDIAPVPQSPESHAGQAPPPTPSSAEFVADSAGDAPLGGACALDHVNGEVSAKVGVAVGTQVLFAGWATDADGNVPAEMRLVLKGERAGNYSAPLAAGVDRPDVAAALGNEAARGSGYLLAATLAVEPGEYEVAVVHGGAAPRTCVLNKHIVVAAAQ